VNARDPRLVLACITLGVIALLSSQSARAQEPGASVVAVDVSNHPTVEVTVDVPGGAAVQSWEVTAVEDGVERAATVIGSERAANEVALVIDTSGSMAGGPMDAAKTAATSFVAGLAEGTAVSVIGFGDQPYVVSPLTGDVAALQQAIAALTAAGETALYDALDLAVDQFSGNDAARSIILVSDGGDTVSGISLPSVTSRLVDAHARLFAVRLATDESNVVVLDALAAATGGRAVDATADPAALTATYETIAASALSQVRLAYQSGGHGRTPVRIVLRSGDIERAVDVTLDLPPAPVTARPAPRSADPAERSTDAGVSVVVGAGAMFVALTFLLQLALVRRPRSLLAAQRRSRAHRRGLREVRDALGERLEHTLESRGRRQALGDRLEQAGLSLRPGEYVVLVLSAAAFTGLCGALIGGPRVGVLFAVLAIVAAAVLLRSRGARRRAAVAEQLPDMLQQLTSSLRAGYGVVQSLDAVARELGGPMSEEIRRVVAEVQLGRDLTESLDALASRAGGTDFEWVVQAIEINREVGGDLVEVIEAVAETIRAREQLQRQIKTLSAEGRLSSRILLAMPFVMAALISLLSPGYLAPLASGAGPLLIVAGCMFMGVGWLWLRKIVRIEL
jgi:tight adherence protein B